MCTVVKIAKRGGGRMGHVEGVRGGGGALLPLDPAVARLGSHTSGVVLALQQLPAREVVALHAPRRPRVVLHAVRRRPGEEGLLTSLHGCCGTMRAIVASTADSGNSPPGGGAGDLPRQHAEGLGGGGAAVGEGQPHRVGAGGPELHVHCSHIVSSYRQRSYLLW